MNETTLDNAAPLLFGWLDFTVFGLMLAVSALIGVYFGFFDKQDTKVEYLLGGKSMKTVPVAVSLVATYISGITLMGVPSEIYRFGSLYVLMCVANIFVALIMNYVYLPVFFELQVTSTYEYLEMRFNRSVRVMSSVLYTIYCILFMPIVVYVPALAFSQVSGMSIHFITPMVGIICIFYTLVVGHDGLSGTQNSIFQKCQMISFDNGLLIYSKSMLFLGGIKAVIWTDFIQSFLMVGACVAVVCLGVLNVGGLGTVVRRSYDGGRINIFDMNPDPTARNTFWTVLIGTTLMWTANGTSQGAIQKYISLPTLPKARQALLVFAIGLIIMKFTSIFTGLIIYATYYECDPIEAQVVKRPDQLLVYFVMDIAGSIPGLPGLFIAGIFSAALSTLSSTLNSLTATIFEDFVRPFLKRQKDERMANYIMRAIVLVVGIICLSLVAVVEKLGGVMELAYSTHGVTAGALLGLFSLGIFFPTANSQGALWGSIASLIVASFIVFGAQNAIATGKLVHKTLPTSVEGCDFNITTNAPPIESSPEETEEAFILFRLSYWYYAVVGTAIVMIVGMIVSAVTGPQNPEDMNQALFAPFLRRYSEKKPPGFETATEIPEKEPLKNESKNDKTVISKNV